MTVSKRVEKPPLSPNPLTVSDYQDPDARCATRNSIILSIYRGVHKWLMLQDEERGGKWPV